VLDVANADGSGLGKLRQTLDHSPNPVHPGSRILSSLGSEAVGSARGRWRLGRRGSPILLVAGDQRVDLAGRAELGQPAVDDAHC
jgi:hypothetical protein